MFIDLFVCFCNHVSFVIELLIVFLDVSVFMYCYVCLYLVMLSFVRYLCLPFCLSFFMYFWRSFCLCFYVFSSVYLYVFRCFVIDWFIYVNFARSVFRCFISVVMSLFVYYVRYQFVLLFSLFDYLFICFFMSLFRYVCSLFVSVCISFLI